MVETLLILKRKNPRRTALMSFLGHIPKLMRSNGALFDQISQLNFSQKNTNHLLGQQLGGRSVDFVDSYRTRKGKKQGEGKINLGIFRLSLGESSATWLYLLVVLFNFLFFFHISIASAFPSFINTSGRWTKILQKLEINYFSFFDFVCACCIVKILFGLGQKN